MLEPAFGQDFSDVRIHRDDRAAIAADALGARAFTLGADIYFGTGQPSLDSPGGQRLLAHELAHTVQQLDARAVPDAVPRADARAEAEAERASMAALAQVPVGPLSRGGAALALQSLDAGAQDAGFGGPVHGGLVLGPLPEAVEHNTELGGLIVGNFDFHFRKCGVLVWVWVKFQFSSDITPAEQAAFKARFFGAVHGTWAHSGYSLQGSGNCACATVPIVIHAEESTTSHYHKLVDVERGPDRREKVISDINVNLSTTDGTLAHEFGHVLGLYDEYDGGWFENMWFWHENRPDDLKALMNEGGELRSRYFEHYRKRAAEAAGPGCTYTIVSPTGK